MIESIKREYLDVIVEIDTGLDVNRNILHFKWNAGNELFAELLKDQLRNQFNEFKKEIARQTAKFPLLYLSREEVSKLKSTLVREWNGANHCWK